VSAFYQRPAVVTFTQCIETPNPPDVMPTEEPIDPNETVPEEKDVTPSDIEKRDADGSSLDLTPSEPDVNEGEEIGRT
jgi:hypothetical protein